MRTDNKLTISLPTYYREQLEKEAENNGLSLAAFVRLFLLWNVENSTLYISKDRIEQDRRQRKPRK